MTTSETARRDVYTAMYNLLNGNSYTYTFDSTVYTWKVLSAFPEVNPTFPCIIVNDAVLRRKNLGSGRNNKKVRIGEIEVEFYAKAKHGKGKVSDVKDQVEEDIAGYTGTGFKLKNSENPIIDSPVDTIDYEGQRLNTATMTIMLTKSN